MATLNLMGKIILILAMLVLLSAGVAIFFGPQITGAAMAGSSIKINPAASHKLISISGTSVVAPDALEQNAVKLITELVDSYYVNDVVAMGARVSQADRLIKSYEDRRLADSWQSLLSCLLSNCDRGSVYAYVFETVEIISNREYAQTKNARYALILDLFETDRLWSERDLVAFSNALTRANELVTSLANKTISAAWTEYIKCGGACANRSELKFNFVRAVAGG